MLHDCGIECGKCGTIWRQSHGKPFNADMPELAWFMVVNGGCPACRITPLPFSADNVTAPTAP